MRSLLLLSAVLAAAIAQAPPHLLFVPQKFYVGTETTFSLTTYSEQFSVTLRLTYQTCTCSRRPECEPEVVYAEDIQNTSSAFSFQPTLLRVKLPSLDELTGRRYYISITSHEGRNVYFGRRQINFYQDSFGFMLVKTDKPIYKPSQTVNICVVYLDSTLRPHNADSTVEVLIRDSRYRQIFKTRITVPGQDGVGCLDIELSEEPNLGQWSVSARLILDAPRRCRYSLPSSTCRFKVDEFVLPRFEVTLEGPKQITKELDTIEGTVDATYTFGEKVQGTVRVNATLESYRRRESFVFYDVTAELDSSGQFDLRIPADNYRNKVLYRYDPFCVRSSVHIVAEVTEKGRNATRSASIVVPLVSNPISVSFHESNAKVFRPELPYTLKGMATRADGSPAVKERVQVTATANNGQKTIVDRSFATDRDGKFSVTVDVAKDTNCLKFTLSPVSEMSCDRQVVCFSPAPMYSPTNSFLQLTHVSPTELRPGTKATVTAEATFNFKTLHLVVIGQGNVQLHQASLSSNNAQGTRKITATIPIVASSVPRVKVLAVVAREDGELVADVIELPVSCELEHEVAVSFDAKVASPGDKVSITTRASPDSVVVLGVIDTSLTLLAEACKSVDTNNVCNLLRRLTGGYGPDSASCSVDSDSACCPSSCQEPSKRAVRDIFTASGIDLTTNMFQPYAPFTPSPTFSPPFFFDRPLDGGDIAVPAPIPESDDGGNFGPAPPDRIPLEPEAPEDVGSSDIRDFFPETWIWEILRTNKSGLAVSESNVVPDTITTWNAEAFAINSNRGLGISPLVELTVKKDLFVSLELPYSIIFKETVTVTPVVFYFGGKRDRRLVRVTVTLDDDLELVQNDLPGSGLVQVIKGSGTPFNIKLKPLAIGHLPITICIRDSEASSRGPCIDAVKKTLFVKPGCERFEITSNVYASGDGEECFDYNLPSCVIPGSAKASISLTGDLLSPPDLDRLLVLPSGCGEQNMVRFSLNVVTGLYLMHTNQLPEHLSVKIRNNLQIGYQRQLNYLQGEGCFSIWSHAKCSLWLTAFTARFLLEASDPEVAPALGLSEGSELVDSSVINSAVTYLVRQQEESGRFPVIGRVHNYYLLRRDDFIGLTAYVVITLRAYLETSTRGSVMISVQRAEQYIVNEYENGTQFCNYGLALSTAALTVNEPEVLEVTTRAMVDDLKRRILNSKNYPNSCFLCNDCPDDADSDSDSNRTECSSKPRLEGSPSCVETTAYALRALLQVGDEEKTACLAQWLVQIKSGNGGFYSSQDTLVAIDALGRFAEETFTADLNKTLNVSVVGLPTITHTITADNRYERRDFEISNLPSIDHCVSYSGVGTAIIQSTLEYYGCNCCNDSRTFSLSLATKETDEVLELFIVIRYLDEGESNMAIVDVEIPSGYVFITYSDPSRVIERQETRGSNAIFYISAIEDAVGFSVRFREVFSVEDHQQLPVTVYDYYEPDQFQTKYYLPVSSGSILIPRPTEPDRITDDIMTTSEPDTGDREEEEEEVSPTLPPTFPTRPTETPPPERGEEDGEE
jgi:CD109 antigen